MTQPSTQADPPSEAYRNEQLIDVVRDTVEQLESLTATLQSFLDNREG